MPGLCSEHGRNTVWNTVGRNGKTLNSCGLADDSRKLPNLSEAELKVKTWTDKKLIMNVEHGREFGRFHARSQDWRKHSGSGQGESVSEHRLLIFAEEGEGFKDRKPRSPLAFYRIWNRKPSSTEAIYRPIDILRLSEPPQVPAAGVRILFQARTNLSHEDRNWSGIGPCARARKIRNAQSLRLERKRCRQRSAAPYQTPPLRSFAILEAHPTRRVSGE